jgi:hypothetical protein
MAQAYFLLIVLGFPVTILLLAMLAGLFHRAGCEDVLDWKPTRSPQREAELHLGEVDQMLAALNRYRRLRGAPERSLEEVALHTANLKLYIGTLPPPDTS